MLDKKQFEDLKMKDYTFIYETKTKIIHGMPRNIKENNINNITKPYFIISNYEKYIEAHKEEIKTEMIFKEVEEIEIPLNMNLEDAIIDLYEIKFITSDKYDLHHIKDEFLKKNINTILNLKKDKLYVEGPSLELLEYFYITFLDKKDDNKFIDRFILKEENKKEEQLSSPSSSPSPLSEKCQSCDEKDICFRFYGIEDNEIKTFIDQFIKPNNSGINLFEKSNYNYIHNKEKVRKAEYIQPTGLNKTIEERINLIRSVLINKNTEYSGDDIDRFINFKRASQITELSEYHTLWGFLAKHIESIKRMIDDLEKDKIPTKEYVQEKIGDFVNYGILLEGLIYDRNNL